MDIDSGPSRSDRFKQWLMPRMTGPHVWVYRRFDGKYGNKTDAGGPVLLLTTTGRRTGSKRTVALGFLDREDSWLVVGSNGGRPQEPAWALNLRADPTADVQIGPDRFEVMADLLEGDQRNVQWNAFVAAYPEYEQAESWSGRRFPLFRLPKWV